MYQEGHHPGGLLRERHPVRLEEHRGLHHPGPRHHRHHLPLPRVRRGQRLHRGDRLGLQPHDHPLDIPDLETGDKEWIKSFLKEYFQNYCEEELELKLVSIKLDLECKLTSDKLLFDRTSASQRRVGMRVIITERNLFSFSFVILYMCRKHTNNLREKSLTQPLILLR